MARPSSLPPPDANITSNVTVPPPTTSASWNGSVPKTFSIMYRGSQQALNNLPAFYFQIANSSQTVSAKQLICDTQIHFCQVAGCSDDDDEISHNFCDLDKGMGTMCTCKKSVSRLAQYQWPVQSQDCLLRLQACIDTCNNQRETPFPQRSECTQACNDQIGSSCSKPEQYGASYMVMKPGQMPTYKIMDQSQPQSAGVTEDEAALYDRQIRLWGLEAQNRMRSAHVLLVGLTGVATEVIKNIVLAGIGSLTILDAGMVREEDLSASFFFREADIGAPRTAEAPLQRVRQLNPHVQVHGRSDDRVLTDEALGALQPDVVLVTYGGRDDLVAWNDVCRRHNVMFFAAGAYGLHGYVFCDLLELDYVVDRPVPGMSEKVPKRFHQTFVPLRESLASTWAFRPSPGLIAIQALWDVAETPDSVEALQSAITDRAASLMQAKGAKAASVFRRVDAASFYGEFARASWGAVAHHSTATFAPTSAILGGILAQAILNALGRREEPIVNWCILDAGRGTADVHPVGPSSLASPESL
ncbi:E1 ubiquitin-activating enzyme [Malassezia caprae]|uniref:Ubiquitin-like 1-activating enzyme E1A n=1 Tax=Malassezia caprae TaxID=1381934 RepID=A0AAF0IZP3_9BASI|nr:E1 ubiquitin-activating enzyme [Malassezia caprae]